MDRVAGDTTVVLSHPKNYYEIISLEEWYKRFNKDPSQEYRVYQYGKFVRAIPVEEMVIDEPMVTVKVFPEKSNSELQKFMTFKCSRNKIIFKSLIQASYPIQLLMTRFRTTRFDHIPSDWSFLTKNKTSSPTEVCLSQNSSTIEIIDEGEHAYPPTKLYTVQILECDDSQRLNIVIKHFSARNFTLGNGLILPGELKLDL
jgi:hypothetical protein